MANARNNIKKEIKGHDILVFLISEKNYSESLKDIVDVSTKNFKKTCYVSLNKPYDTLIPMFQKAGIKTRNFIFIDCVKVGIKGFSDVKVVFVSSPKALTEMDIAIKKALDKEKFDGLVFDSLSTLLVYEEPSTLIKFSHSVISKLRSAGVKGIFLALKDDVKSELMKDLSMFVDKVVEV